MMMRDNGSTGKTVSPVNPHFRKIVLSRTLTDNKLRVPIEFMRRYGSKITNPVGVRVPGGSREWKMVLTEGDENGDVWLAKGWPEFAKHYDLQEGQSLYFKYKGGSLFKVVIIGKYGLEIDYPVMPSDSDGFNESDVEMVDDEEEDRERGRVCESEIEWPVKRRKTANRKDAAASSDNFSVRLSGNSLRKLRVPMSYSKEHFNCETGRHLKLQIGDKFWPVKFVVTPSGGNFFFAGWRAFVKDNSLKLGDSCTFVRVSKDIDVVLEVTISQTKDAS